MKSDQKITYFDQFESSHINKFQVEQEVSKMTYNENLILNANLTFCASQPPIHISYQNADKIIAEAIKWAGLQKFYQQPSSFYFGVIFLIFYAIYVYFLKFYVIRKKSNINPKSKNVGRPLPSFPNGWYNVCHSDQIKMGQTKAIDIAGQNIVIFRSTKGQLFGLQAYCKHMGANLGVEGKVVNQKCVQCPFHGWIYDGQSGLCVDYDGKPVRAKSVEYNQDFCKKNVKKKIQMRKYPVRQMACWVFVWVHALPQKQQTPDYEVLDISSFLKERSMQRRGYTEHSIQCHIADIPQNGADILHFKYVHNKVTPGIQSIKMIWQPNWCRGDDQNLYEKIFTHKNSNIQKFKQKNTKIKGFFQSLTSIAKFSYPFFLPFSIQISVFQLGSSLVYIFLKFPTHEVVFHQYLRASQPYQTSLYMDMFASWYLPYWIGVLILQIEGTQVSNDMVIWSSKKFGRKLYCRQGFKSDDYIRQWREWFSQNYEGTEEKERNLRQSRKDYSW